MKNLVKEIITTETEKFTEDGKIKERVKETREKIYEKITEKEEAEAQIEEAASTPPPSAEEKEVTRTLVEDAAKAIDAKKNEEVAKPNEAAGYNVVSRTTPYPMGGTINAAPTQFTPPVFPWENK